MADRLYRREAYLEKIRPFVDDTGIIKVVTGIRRCGKSCLMETVAEEVIEHGVPAGNIIFIDLEKRGLRSVKTPDQLEAVIEGRIPSGTEGTVYLFIDEVQRVEGFEEVVNAYRADGGFSVFITGSNSYLLSGELMTNLTGRYIEIELFTLTFSEYLEMREFLGKPAAPEAQLFREFLRYGGFPKSLELDDPQAKARYIEEVVGQIIDKDIRSRHKIRNRSTFEKVMTYIINNFAAPTNLTGIAEYLRNTQGIPIKRETLASYIELLVKAKLLYRCDRFDMKSKRSLQGGEKYYLADTGIYFARNVNATMDYGPLLENAVYTYLKYKDYRVSVGRIGKLEVDFIARRADEGYAYIQVSLSVADRAVEEREYRPFSRVRDNYPQYLLTLDPLPLERDGVTHHNLVELMASSDEL
ncbi:ATP-binding protein [Olsenella sp. Marseille-P4559]|uniref:ATP-binding protein n=1 Tax=Olsenella sp. Marseille-P4559 TaxID=2364795 RepID=UPI00102FF885|nr:ATP-binding protein [Olsenella sp. Marseille-P4559]